MRYPAICVILMLFPMFAQAALRDKYIDNAQLCTRYFPGLERKHAIPENLLAAIASTESGRWHDNLQLALPWPWTINVEGKGFYFDSKAEAVRKVKQLQRQGKDSIDIGCMQVNLRHHPDAFASVEDAFDPAQNTAYAARFLRSNYDESQSWLTATAAYHSRTPTHGRKYLGLIERQWTRIADRVSEAGNRSGARSISLSKPKELSSLQKAVARDALHLHAGKDSPKKKTRSASTRSMRAISVTDRSEWEARRKSVMLITPTTRKSVSKPAEGSKRDAVNSNSSMIVADRDVQKTKGVSIKVTGADGTTTRSDTLGQPVFIFSQ